jgi:hypothetical protein
MSTCAVPNECPQPLTDTEPLALLFQLRTAPLTQFETTLPLAQFQAGLRLAQLQTSAIGQDAADSVWKQRLMAAGIVAVLVLTAVVVINFIRDKRQLKELRRDSSNASSASRTRVGTPKHAAAKLSGKYGIVDQSLVLDKCDYVMVFPLWTGASRRVHTTGNGRDMKLHWDEEVDGLELARRIFRDPCKQHLLEEEGLEEWVSSKMTFENYNSAVRQLLVKLLGGPKFGLDMEKFASYDLDEVFLTIRLPRKENGLRQYAAHFSYSMPLSDFAYEQIDMKVPKDEHGRTMRTYAHFLPDYLQYFENFRQADKLRLLDAQLEKYINVEALMKQNILADHFNAH